MNIQQVEQTTGLTARQIREYEKIGLIPAITRTPSGYRDYSQDSIERLQFIKRARDVDFSLAEIKVLLAMQDNPCRNDSEVKALTAQHIVTLNEDAETIYLIALLHSLYPLFLYKQSPCHQVLFLLLLNKNYNL